MNYAFSDQQLQLRKRVEDFIDRHYDLPSRLEVVNSQQNYRKETWQIMSDLGLLKIPFSTTYGGTSGAAMDTYMLMEALARGLIVEPLVASVILSGSLISNSCNESTKQHILPKVVSGELMLASAIYEPGGRYDLSRVAARAKPRRLGFSLSGKKSVVLNGGAADKIILSARTGGGDDSASGISLFLLDSDIEGMTIHRYKNIDGHAAADIVLEDVFVDRRTLIGEKNEALLDIEQAVDTATLAICCEALGVMAIMNKMTLEHCKTRKQFGVPLSNFQALRHKMVDMVVEYEQAKSSVLFAALSADENNGAAPLELSAAKYRVGIAARKIAHETIQLHGASGISEQSDVGHYFKRLTAIEAQFGNSDYHLNRYIELSREQEVSL